MKQGLDIIKKSQKILVPGHLVQSPLIASIVKF